ncbi:hypothetical protein FOCC_FOCC000350 [Frankliniella occidentalis]|uniref:Uncharacterized protein LOC113210363 n=1 Tax=Frankliniella occidentalis TaxID=133901 RepID=A0A6J1STB6_FRAOC|nr:uncharacterized protein LOC113210363 [Frankliniella occidentalis]KAE8753004.1 hypothetical protein FOCC_FOCC000350 [Frankliniella occidentalis]
MHQHWNQTFHPSVSENLPTGYDSDFCSPGRWQPAMRNTLPWSLTRPPQSVPSQVPLNYPNRSLVYHPRVNERLADYYGPATNFPYEGLAAYQSFQRRFQMFSDIDHQRSNDKFYGHEPQLVENKILESRGLLREQSGPTVVRARQFSNSDQFHYYDNQSSGERLSSSNPEQCPAPMNSVLNSCDTELIDPNVNTEIQQNFNYNLNTMEGEDTNDNFSQNAKNAKFGDNSNLTTDRNRQDLHLKYGGITEVVDEDSVEIIEEVFNTSQEIMLTPTAIPQNLLVRGSAEKANYVSVIRHTGSLIRSDNEAPDNSIIIGDPCAVFMDCNNNNNDNNAEVKSVESSNILEKRKNMVFPLQGTIINWNGLKKFRNFALTKSQKFRPFYELDSFNISQNCEPIQYYIHKKGNMEKCSSFLSVLVFPFYTFQISIDVYFLFLNICTHFHIFFSGLKSCLTYFTMISNLSHFLVEQKAKPAKDEKLCLAEKSIPLLFGPVKPENLPYKICSVLPDKHFHGSRQILIKNNFLYFRKGQNDTFRPLKICGNSPSMLKKSKLKKMKLPEILHAKNGCSIPIFLLKQQICGTCSEMEWEETLIEILQASMTYFQIENIVEEGIVFEQTNCNQDQSRIGEQDYGNNKKEKVRGISDTKIGMYVVKPISIRRAQSAKKFNKNLFSVKPTWVYSDLKLFFEQVDSDNESFVSKSKYGIFEIKPIMNCLGNSPHVRDEPYTVKYIMPDEKIKILLIKEQNAKANKKSRNKLDVISSEKGFLVKEIDDLSNNDKKNTLLLLKRDNGYENVGQEPIQIILEKLGIHGYPFLVNEVIEYSSEPISKPQKTLAYSSNQKKNQLIGGVEPMAPICLDIATVLNSSSEALSLLDTCEKLAENFIRHGISVKQKFGCMRKIFSDSEQEDLLKVMCEKGDANVYEAVRKYLNVNFKGIGEFKNCMGFRQVKGVRSVLAQGNITRSDDNLFLFYDVPMRDGRSQLSLQVVINRRLPNESQSLNSAEVRPKSETECYSIDEATQLKVDKEQFFSPKRQQASQDMDLEQELERELEMIHGEAPSHKSLLIQNTYEKSNSSTSLEFMCENKPLNLIQIGSDLSELKVLEDASTYNKLGVQIPLTHFTSNEILHNEYQDNPHYLKVESSPEINLSISSIKSIQNCDDLTSAHTISDHNLSNKIENLQDVQNFGHESSDDEACHLQLKKRMLDAYYSNSNPSHPKYRGRSSSPPSKKPRHSHGVRKNHKLLKTLSIQQYIDRNPLKDAEAAEINHSPQYVSLMSKNNFVHTPSHIIDYPLKLDKSNIYNRNQQSHKCQYSSVLQKLHAGLKDRKLLHSQNCDVCFKHRPPSHFSQHSPSFEIRNPKQRNRKRRCSESDSFPMPPVNHPCLVSFESIPSSSIEGSICRYCDKSFNRHSYRDGQYKCPKITKNGIKMYQERTWMKSYNSRMSSSHGVTKHNSRMHADCFAKEQNNIKIYTDPECFENIVASTLTREDEDALQRVVTEGDIFLYSPEKKPVSQDPRFRKKNLNKDPLESNSNKKIIAPIIGKPTVTSVPMHDMKPIIKYDGINLKDTSTNSVKTLNNSETIMKYNEKCLNFLKKQAQYFSDNPEVHFYPLPIDSFDGAQSTNESNKTFDFKNFGNDQPDLSDSNLALGAQPAASPGQWTSTLTPFAALSSQYGDSSNIQKKKVSRKDEPYSPGSPTSTLSG